MMSVPLDRISIVLVNPSHAGNIGGVARAMKNMGLSSLRLVAPGDHLAPEACARAAGAIDVLKSAQVYPVLADALKDCRLAIGASARKRRVDWPALNPQAAAATLCEKSRESQVALVLGREKTGLENEELDQCHYISTLETAPEYTSLNLVCAAQVYSYLIYTHALQVGAGAHDASAAAPSAERQARHEDLQHFYRHLEETLCQIGFLNPVHPRQLMRKLQRFFNRALPEENELHMLRGILTAVDKGFKKTSQK